MNLPGTSRGATVWLSELPAFLLGYLIGSVPSAFLLVHWNAKVDIRTAGSGNVGALNSLEVTGSKWVGAAVLLLDLAKGVFAVLLASTVLGGEFWIRAAAGLGAVAGHNFPVWLRFRGGRGLSTAAGAMLVLVWVFVPVWLAVWLAAFLTLREVNLGNATACVICMAMVLVLPGTFLESVVPADVPVGAFRGFTAILLSLLMLKLVDPVYAHFRKDRSVQ
jgi:glycerol-3-phosphate acyltransferase PlsY